VALYEVAGSYTSAGFGGLNKWSDGMEWSERPCKVISEK